MGDFLKLLMILFLVLVLGFLGIYFYFLKGLNKDLGIVYSESDYKAGLQKSGISVEKLTKEVSPEKSIEYEGKHSVNAFFTSNELTSLAQGSRWAYFPFKNLQVKINEDNTIEATGYLNIEKIIIYLQALGILSDKVNIKISGISIPRMEIPFYAKGSGSFVADKANIDITTLEFSKIIVPPDMLTNLSLKTEKALEDFVLNDPNIDIRSIKIEKEKLLFDGILPDKELVVTVN